MENSQLGKGEAEWKEQLIQQEARNLEMNSARILNCVEENRAQKIQIMELLQEKESMVQMLTSKNSELAREVGRLKNYNEHVSQRSRQELLQLQQQISSVQGMAHESKSFHAKYKSAEEALRRQQHLYEQQLHERDDQIGALETSIQYLNCKLTEASQTPRALLPEKFATPDTPKKRSADDVIGSLVAEKEELNSKYTALAAKFEEQDRLMQEYVKNVKDLEEALKLSKDASFLNPSIQALLMERQKREAKLLKHLQELERNHSEWLKNFDIQAKENSELKESALKLEQRLKNTEALIKECENSKQEALSKVSALQRECADVQSSNKQQIDKIEEEKAGLMGKLEKEVQRYKDAVKRLQLECDTKTKRILEFKTLYGKMELLSKESKNEVSFHQDMSSKLKKNADLLQKELIEIQKHCQILKEEKNKLGELCAAAQKSDAANKEALEKHNQDVRKKLETIKTDHEKITTKLQTSKDRCSTLEQELQRMNAQLAESQTGADKLQTEKMQLAEKVQQLRSHCETLEANIGELKKAETKNLSRLTETERLLKEKTADYAAKDAELKMIEAGLDTETKSLFANLAEKNDKLSEKCCTLEADLEKSRAADEWRQAEIVSLRKDNEGLQQEILRHTNWVKTKALGQINSGDSSSGDDVESSGGADSALFGLLLEQLIFAMENNIKSKDQKLQQCLVQIEKQVKQIADLEQNSKLRVAEVAKGQSMKSAFEKRLKSLTEEKIQLTQQLTQLSKDKSALLEELEVANSTIKNLRSNEIKQREMIGEKEHKIEAASCKSESQLQKIHELEEQNRGLHSKLSHIDGKNTELLDTNQRQKQQLHLLSKREKSRAEIQKQLQQFADEYNLVKFPDEMAESPLHVLECLIDKFGGNADHQQYIKLCKTLRNRLMKDEKKTQLANQIVKLMTSNKKAP